MNTKTDLSEITFVIPFMYDGEFRLNNLNAVAKYLLTYFNTNIKVVETGEQGYFKPAEFENKVSHSFYVDKDGVFYRTKTINYGIAASETPYIAIYDTDVIFMPENYTAALNLLKNGSSMVYPYSGEFVDIKPEKFYETGEIAVEKTVCEMSFGGAVFLNRKDYINAGLENENIISWGWEDNERYNRMKILNYKISRVSGICYHLCHPRGINSSDSNPYIINNQQEAESVRRMNKDELINYINSWGWLKNICL